MPDRADTSTAKSSTAGGVVSSTAELHRIATNTDTGTEPQAKRNTQRPKVVIVPIGGVDKELLRQVVAAVEQHFELDFFVADPVQPKAQAWYAPRKRWRAEKLLNQLDSLPLEADRVIGVTELEISTSKGDRVDWGIAGLGRMPGKSCVLTAYLFRKLKRSQAQKYRRYVENLVLHEFGHTLGLPHCPLDRCIMADAKGNALRAARISSNAFCPRCHRQIQQFLRYEKVQEQWSASERARIGIID